MTQVASIVILAHGNRPATERCLETLECALGDELGRSFELVLVDNASPDDTDELFESWSDRATVLSMSENRNFAGGCNAGARAATGDVLVFLNNDTEVPAGALDVVVAQAREPGVGAVGARLLYPDGTLQHAGVVHRHIPSGEILPFHLFHHEAGDLPQARAVLDLDAVTGACLAIPKILFEQVGGFREDYVNGLEDIDLCLRIRTAGHRVVYRGDVAIIHHERMTRGADHDESANAGVFVRRWQSMLDGDAELMEHMFDVRPRIPPVVAHGPDVASGAGLAVAGRLRSPAPEAFEARALLAALDAAGIEVASRRVEPVWEEPPGGGPEWDALDRAERRQRSPSAATIAVAGGPLASFPAGHAAVARLAGLTREGAGLAVSSVWAASPAVADELIRGGFPAGDIAWLPPAVPDLAVGPGGGGLLVLLPAHDPGACRALLASVSAFPGIPVRVLPNVRSRAIESLAAERAPSAELLSPVLDERALAGLAASADVVCGTDGDGFERRALVAAASGAAVVTLGRGPAAAVLGEAHVVDGWADPAELGSAVGRALDDAGHRAGRARAVQEACGPEALSERLVELVSELEAARNPGSPLTPALL